MLALESRIERTLEGISVDLKEHAEAAAALGRFRILAQTQREALQARLPNIGGSDPGSARITSSAEATDVPGEGRPQTVSGALQTLNTLFNQAAFGYACLHLVAHRFYDSVDEGNTADLAEKHLRSYAEAAQGISQLLSDVVIWELGNLGQQCQCRCPSCSLGVCLCSPHGTNTVRDLFRETAPAEAEQASRGIRVRPPRAKSAADRAGLRSGDVLVAVDNEEIENEGWESLRKLQDAIRKHQPTEVIRLRVHRASGDLEEISVTRP